MAPIPICYLARHGQTLLNQKNCYRGSVDVDLDDTGYNQANRLAYYFEPIELSHIFCSSRQRAVHTAEAVASRKDMEVISHDGLRALNVGHLGGKPKNEENIAVVREHVENPSVPFPGGESLNDFRARVRPLLQDAIEVADRSGEPVLLVVHSSVIHEAGEMIHGDHRKALVKPGGVSCIFYNDGKLEVEPIFRPDSEEASRPEIIT